MGELIKVRALFLMADIYEQEEEGNKVFNMQVHVEMIMWTGTNGGGGSCKGVDISGAECSSSQP